MFGAVIGYLIELGYFQTSIRILNQKNLFFPLLTRETDGFKIIRFLMLCVFSLLFYLLTLLLSFTRDLPRTKTTSDPFSPSELTSHFDSTMHLTAVMNELFGHTLCYLLIFAFAKKCFHVFLLIDISLDLKRDCPSH